VEDKLIITRAGVEEATAITSLSVTTFTETFAAQNDADDMARYLEEEMSLEQLTKELSDTQNYFFLATYDGTPAGYAKARATKIPTALAGRKPLEIERIYVLQAHHGKKVGAGLMQHCMEHARTNGYDVIWLGVWEHNYKAVNFYKRWGFELFGSHIFRLGTDDQTDVLMKKEIG
jgi:ribosomal protein S18 acetylase RimI-like enzyme